MSGRLSAKHPVSVLHSFFLSVLFPHTLFLISFPACSWFLFMAISSPLLPHSPSLFCISLFFFPLPFDFQLVFLKSFLQGRNILVVSQNKTIFSLVVSHTLQLSLHYLVEWGTKRKIPVKSTTHNSYHKSNKYSGTLQ